MQAFRSLAKLSAGFFKLVAFHVLEHKGGLVKPALARFGKGNAVCCCPSWWQREILKLVSAVASRTGFKPVCSLPSGFFMGAEACRYKSAYDAFPTAAGDRPATRAVHDQAGLSLVIN